jgi:hypothetical protein
MPTTIARRTRRIVMRMTTATTTQMQNCRESWIVCAESERRGRRKRYVCALILYRVCLANTSQEAERLKEEEEARERNIALGNPLLNKQDFNMKRRWDDDVVFKNQARGTEDKGKKKEFVNVSLEYSFILRSSFCRLLSYYTHPVSFSFYLKS